MPTARRLSRPNRRLSAVARLCGHGLLLLSLLSLQLASAQKPAVPVPCPPIPSIAETLARLNGARAHGAPCGTVAGAVDTPLRWDDRLALSAREYAAELAGRRQLSHEGLAHPRLRDRVRAAGYRFRLIAENLAVGPEHLDELLSGWLASPDHCANLMEARFVDVGLACASSSGSQEAGERFWVLHLGRTAEL